MNWKAIIGHALAFIGSQGSVVAFVPPKYQAQAAAGIAFAQTMAALFQKSAKSGQ